MITRRVLSALAAVALLGAAALVAAPAATAKTEAQTWHQSVGRLSAEAACPSTSDSDSDAGWSQWESSWAMWPNDGAGGWVCDRSNTWLRASEDSEDGDGTDSAPSVGCIKVGSRYGNFKGGFALAKGALKYSTSACDTPLAGNPKFGASYVYAPAGQAQGDQLCQAAFQQRALKLESPSVYQCK